MDVRHLPAGRSDPTPARFRLFGDGQFESVRTRAPGEESCLLGPDTSAIEPGLEGQEQFCFAPQSRGFLVAGLPADTFDLVQEAEEATGQAVGICHPVAG